MRRFLLLFLLLSIMFGCSSSILDDPSTNIQYSISEPSYVKVTVENSYNTMISTLIDQEQDAGIYSVIFNASNLAEGVYFYTIEAKGLLSNNYYKTTKKLLLIK